MQRKPLYEPPVGRLSEDAADIALEAGFAECLTVLGSIPSQ